VLGTDGVTTFVVENEIGCEGCGNCRPAAVEDGGQEEERKRKRLAQSDN